MQRVRLLVSPLLPRALPLRPPPPRTQPRPRQPYSWVTKRDLTSIFRQSSEHPLRFGATGAAIVRSPKVAKILFIGSPEVGAKVPFFHFSFLFLLFGMSEDLLRSWLLPQRPSSPSFSSSAAKTPSLSWTPATSKPPPIARLTAHSSISVRIASLRYTTITFHLMRRL